MTPFALFLIPYCALIYYVFEILWERIVTMTTNAKGEGNEND